jgi:hypothetical protein
MTSSDRIHRPFGTLFLQQLRTVGLAIRREAALALALLAAICILSVSIALRQKEALNLDPELLHPTLLAALLMPWAVWKGDPVFGRAYLWTLPVRRHQAAMAKVGAGALWLMLGMLVTLVSLALVSLVTGGRIGEVETRLVQAGSGGLTAMRVPWSTPWWMWLAHFGAALTLYLLSSAALLGLRQPVRWLAGLAAVTTFIVVLALNYGARGLEDAITRLIMTVVGGTYGLDFAVTGGEVTLVRDVRGLDRRVVDLWTELPSFGRWVSALSVWLGLTLLALALAIRRHWER